MTTNPGSRPLAHDDWGQRSHRLARRERWRARHEALAARLGVSPRAVLGLILVTLAVVGVLSVRVVLAAHAGAAAVPIAPAAVGAPDRSRSTSGPHNASAAAASSGPEQSVARPGPGGSAGVAPASGVPNSSASPGPVALPGYSEPPGSTAGQARIGASAAGVGAIGSAPAGLPAGTAAELGGTGPDGGEVVVHVVGRVRRPGVVRLPQGSRVEQAVIAAGGARSDADLSRVNLARLLVDGEQVVVPRPGESALASGGPGSAVGASGSVVGGTIGPQGSGSGAMRQAAQVVDINTATPAELDTLPGVGPVLAQRIVDWRAQNGQFTSVDELGEVSGIGDAVLARLRPLVRL